MMIIFTPETDLNFSGADRTAVTMLPLDRTTHCQEIARNVVGKRYKGWDGNVYLCDGYDPRQGFWMQRVDDPTIRRNVSERAIGSTFHVHRE